jgi:hypothetical protein
MRRRALRRHRARRAADQRRQKESFRAARPTTFSTCVGGERSGKSANCVSSLSPRSVGQRQDPTQTSRRADCRFHAPQDDTYLVRPRADDRNEAPVLDFLRPRMPSSPTFPIGCQMHRYSCTVPDFRMTLSASGKRRNFQHLFGSTSLPFCRVSEMGSPSAFRTTWAQKYGHGMLGLRSNSSFAR